MRDFFSFPQRSIRFFWVMIATLNVCLMTFEIAAGRLLAPFIGVSLIVWASVIGVVMCAMACGYAMGAWASRRRFSREVLLGSLLGAGLTIAGAQLVARFFGSALLATEWPLFCIALCLSFFVLFLPAFFLAAVHPLCVLFATADKAHAGRTVGVLNMAAALGSIVGTFLTGFVWLMWFSVSTILWVMAGVVLAVFFGGLLFLRVENVRGSGETVSLPTRFNDQSLWFYLVLAFVSGFGFMAMEIAAGRALAPSLGTSVFAWTSVIGAILLGTTFGNTVGGILADREGSRMLLGKTFAWAGIATLLSLYVTSMSGSLFVGVGMPLALRTILFSLMAFLPSAFALGMISPQLVKLALSEVKGIGSVVGILTASNTIGGLVGALLTGFFLISLVGTRGVFVGVALLCVWAGIVLFQGKFPWNRRITILLIILFLLPAAFPRLCDRETQYYCIQILKDTGSTKESPRYILRLDHLVHSYVHLGHPEALGYGYEQVYAHLLTTFTAPTSTFSSLFIGGGGYVLPRYIESEYPTARVVVSEIDPGVAEANHDYLGLSRATKVQTEAVDARMYLARLPARESFDFVFGDAFNDFSVPYHLTTVEFHELLKSHMSAKGIYALNIIDDPRYGQFLSSMIRTLRHVWKQVYVAPGAATFRGGRNTIVLIASDEPIDPLEWRQSISPAAQKTQMDREEYIRLTQLMSQDKVDAFLTGHEVPPLTDAFVPTDRYLAPVFSDAY